MNGECIKYASLKNPMSWEDFKKLPEDLAVQYVKSLRKKYNVPNNALANMFGVDPAVVSVYFKSVGLFIGSGAGGKRTWDKDGFLAWCGGAKDGVVQPSETPVEEETVDIQEDGLVVICDEPEIVTPEMEAKLEELVKDDVKDDSFEKLKEAWRKTLVNRQPIKIDNDCGESHTVIPERGEMTFQGNVDDILRTISKLLNGRQVRLEVEWDVLG